MFLLKFNIDTNLIMDLLKEVANISGRSGLFRILKPGRGGVIVQSLDGTEKREMISANARVSVLNDISIYTEDYNKSTPLAEVFLQIREKHGEKVTLDLKDITTPDLFDFMGEVMPDFDRERVNPSDIKKIIQWYNILAERLPEVFTVATATEEEK